MDNFIMRPHSNTTTISTTITTYIIQISSPWYCIGDVVCQRAYWIRTLLIPRNRVRLHSRFNVGHPRVGWKGPQEKRGIPLSVRIHLVGIPRSWSSAITWPYVACRYNNYPGGIPEQQWQLGICHEIIQQSYFPPVRSRRTESFRLGAKRLPAPLAPDGSWSAC